MPSRSEFTRKLVPRSRSPRERGATCPKCGVELSEKLYHDCGEQLTLFDETGQESPDSPD